VLDSTNTTGVSDQRVLRSHYRFRRRAQHGTLCGSLQNLGLHLFIKQQLD